MDDVEELRELLDSQAERIEHLEDALAQMAQAVQLLLDEDAGPADRKVAQGLLENVHVHLALSRCEGGEVPE